MIANGQKLEWEGGSFSPNAKRVGHGTGGGRLAKNITRWSSKEPLQAARLFVGFNVGDQPVHSMSDLVDLVSDEQGGETGSTFVSQRGTYRHSATFEYPRGQVIEEEGAQVILINTDFLPEEQFREEIVALAEKIASDMEQEEVIVELQKGGVTQEVLGVGAELAPNADWEASARVAYRGRLTGGEPVEHTLETRADEPERELTLANRNGRAYWQPPELRGKRHLERERGELEGEVAAQTKKKVWYYTTLSGSWLEIKAHVSEDAVEQPSEGAHATLAAAKSEALAYFSTHATSMGKKERRWARDSVSHWTKEDVLEGVAHTDIY
jgi:hypothetical protein